MKITVTPAQINEATIRLTRVNFKAIVHENEINIFNSACPESIFANKRTLRLITLEPYEIISIIVKKGTIIIGVPEGTNCSKKEYFFLKIIKQFI